MIQYSLVCENTHTFEAWFKSASAYDDQVKLGVVTCPVCATSQVNKALMAPSVTRKSNRDEVGVTSASASDESLVGGDQDNLPSAAPQGGVALSAGHPDQKKLRKVMRDLRNKITAEADYVGDRFAEEARKIHDEGIEARSIYGEATAEETASLLEDGVDILPLPLLPEEQN